MSILMKKPRIEEIADALGDAKKTLLSVLDGPGEYARFDLEKGPLPVGGAPLVRRSILSYKGREYPGVYLRTTLGSHFIEVSGKEECAAYEVDEANRSLRKVDEPLTAEELRRVLGGGSGGGSGLPDDYAQQLQEHIGFSNGNVQIGNGVEINGNILSGLIGKATLPVKAGGETITTLDCWIGEGVEDRSGQAPQFYFAVFVTLEGGTVGVLAPEPMACCMPICTRFASQADYDVCHTMDEVLDGGFIPYELIAAIAFAPSNLVADIQERVSDLRKSLNGCSRARYQHTVTLSGDGFEFCFTAKSSKNVVIDSYQDLGIVFGGQRIGLTGYSHALSAKPVLIDLHGRSESNDFIRVFEENGNTFANHTLSSLGAITFADDVCIPN